MTASARPVPLALVRHGPTLWNEEKRIQGQMDPSLSENGRARVSGWNLPAEVAGFRWYVSPKKRAVETARLLGLTPAIEPSLAEMSWGNWEGHLLADLRAQFGEEMAENERRGLDFRPPNGESPRDVQTRVKGWLRRIAGDGEAAGAVAHAGVIRAIYALASGWDMTGKPPVKLEDGHLHLFVLDGDGAPQVDRLNIPLAGA